ncbi:MAG TPA: nicotinate (nicotinamide) nucleotide adenylyltransferase [Terracidiphilus sp.]|jgi:nicotinate-nucleotide adenylyltransferase|nr:nicotinate (nicotinamide) nucleotide adenylyltransferase [Terracidiphilus sp.]
MTNGEARRVAFFGGSFDPPHLGHLAVARAARAALQLDSILFAPVGAQPLKAQGSTASFDDRLHMTELAIAGEPGLEISRIDAPDPEGRPNYTLDTLHRLRSQLPEGVALFCLMGADSFLSLRQWHGAAEIPFAATLVVASRPGQSLADLESSLPEGVSIASAGPPNLPVSSGIELVSYALRNHAGRTAAFHLLPGLDVEISASEIRRQIRGEASRTAERELLPPAVARYIREHGLYL